LEQQTNSQGREELELQPQVKQCKWQLRYHPIQLILKEKKFLFNIGQIWDRMQMPLDSLFAYQVSPKIMEDNPDPKTIKQAMKLSDGHRRRLPSTLSWIYSYQGRSLGQLHQ
jgi:hypothetical protein